MFHKRPSRFLPLSLALLFLASFFAGCDAGLPIKVGDTPEISAFDLKGGKVPMDKYKGKVVVIYFWSESCCGEKVRLLEPWYRQNKDKGLEILAINEHGSQSEAASFVQKTGVSFPVLIDKGSKLFKRFGAFGFPTVFVLDRNGTVRERILGEAESSLLDTRTAFYLATAPAQK